MGRAVACHEPVNAFRVRIIEQRLHRIDCYITDIRSHEKDNDFEIKMAWKGVSLQGPNLLYGKNAEY